MPTPRRPTTATARKRTSRKREEAAPGAGLSDALLSETFLEMAPDAIVVADAAGQIVRANQQTEALFGYPRAALLGQPVEQLVPARFHDIHRRHRADYAASPRTRPMGVGLELMGRRQDGTEFPVEVSLSPLSVGTSQLVIAIIRDVTERKRLEAAERFARTVAEQRLALLQTVLDQLPGGAYLVRGPQAELVMANRAAEAVWGATWSMGLPMVEFLRTSGVRYYAENGQPFAPDELITTQIVRGGPLVRQQLEVMRRRDGSRLPILLSALAIDAALLDVAHAGTDASIAPFPAAAAIRPEAQPAAERAALVLIQDISLLQAAERLKDEFISMATHELRTPLAAIQGFASMLRVQTGEGHGPTLADWQQEAIDEIESATGRLNDLVDDLLDATRIQAGRLELHLVPQDLVGLVRRCLNQLQLTTAQHTLTLEAPTQPVLLAVDGLRLEQVLGNLIGNAIKYSPAGGPITVTILVERAAEQAEIRIRDHGIGIPAAEQVRLFQRFSRASNVHDHRIPGSGLGLFVCRELVERHGGRIWFESIQGEGTTFFLTLPLAGLPSEEDSTAPDGEGPAAGDANQRLSQRRSHHGDAPGVRDCA